MTNKLKFTQVSRVICPKSGIHFLDACDKNGIHWMAQQETTVEPWITYKEVWYQDPQQPVKIMTEKEQDENLKNCLDRIHQWGEENKSPTLWEIIRNDLGYSVDLTNEIIDAVKKWLPKEDPRPSYATMQWDKCVRMMKEKLE